MFFTVPASRLNWLQDKTHSHNSFPLFFRDWWGLLIRNTRRSAHLQHCSEAWRISCLDPHLPPPPQFTTDPQQDSCFPSSLILMGPRRPKGPEADHHPGWHPSNTYLRLAQRVATRRPNPHNGHVCGFFPHHIKGLPTMPCPLPVIPATCWVTSPQTRQLLCDPPDKKCYSCHSPSPITLTVVQETGENGASRGKGNIRWEYQIVDLDNPCKKDQLKNPGNRHR